MNKLKPCPFCGSEHVEAESFEYGWAKCVICGSAAKKSHWNNRQELEPQPNQSVVTWITYDGTPETLPEIGATVMLVTESNTGSIFNALAYRIDDEMWIMIYDAEEYDILVGDKWAYLPAPPEVK